MASLKAYKMDGLGNSFIIIDRRNKDVSLSKEKIIKLKKTENFDQLIYIEKEQGNVLPITIIEKRVRIKIAIPRPTLLINSDSIYSLIAG